VLRDYGNMSAATVLFVLRRALDRGFEGLQLMSALGPASPSASSCCERHDVRHDIAYALLVAVAGARLAELAVARHNTRHLLAEGGVEIGAAHYPLFFLLHGAWLACLALTVDASTRVDLRLVALLGLLQLGRL